MVSSIFNLGKNLIVTLTFDSFRILSSSENKDIEPIIKEYFNSKNIKVSIDYAGIIDIMDKINKNENYDAIWSSNSILLYMIEDSSKIKDSK